MQAKMGKYTEVDILETTHALLLLLLRRWLPSEKACFDSAGRVTQAGTYYQKFRGACITTAFGLGTWTSGC